MGMVPGHLRVDFAIHLTTALGLGVTALLQDEEKGARRS